ncbi:MAG TPA: type II secretion system protein [Opitutaceae bacterium]|nr:type II secretion system protein [Opitutaceae bacterium]
MNRRGFTLIELLVAMGLSMAIIAVLAVLVGRFGEAWAQASGRLVAQTQARVALDQLEADLQGAFVRGDGQPWLAVRLRAHSGDVPLWTDAGEDGRQKPAALSLRQGGGAITGDRFGVGGCWLRFFSAQRMTESSAGLPVAVGYQIVRRRMTGTSEARYYLHRSEVRPVQDGTGAGVWESGYALAASGSSPYMCPGPGNAGAEGDPVTLSSPGALGTLLADSVVDFGVRLYARDGTGGLRLVYPQADVGAEYLAGAREEMPWPAEAELMLRVLTPEGAALLANIEAVPCRAGARPSAYASDAEWWWAVVEEHSRVHVRRVELIARP